MRIGVVCEGPTDYPAIAQFFRHALLEQNIRAEFLSLFPDIDRTQSNGGWANVLLWLQNNPPISRIQKYFKGGLFAGDLASQQLDAIIIHLDADILPNDSFISFVKRKYDINIIDANSPADRGSQIMKVIEIAAGFDSMTKADCARHVPAPAVESTETWCIAAFTLPPTEFEMLRGGQLTHLFMAALERSEGREPQEIYENIDKNPQRRQRFCEQHAVGSARVINGCQHFSSVMAKLQAINAQ
jgi:hypothetical protein